MRKKRAQSTYWRKYKVNETTFDSIDTEAKAYLLGFIAADGYVSRDGLGFTLHERDKDILETILAITGSTHVIRPITRNRLALDISSRVLAQRLTALGLGGAKTFTMQSPHEIPTYLLHHWLRGYWDGDGWLTTRKCASGLAPVVAVAGWSEVLMKFIQGLCSEYTQAEVTLGKLRGGWQIKILSKKAKRWLERVYLHANVGLARKRILAEQLYNLPDLSLATAQRLRRSREYQAIYAKRNLEIVRLRTLGMKLKDIGDRFGLKPSSVCAIAKKGSLNAQV